MSKLENRDYVIVIDKSGSMGATDTKSGVTRFKEAEESTIALANAVAPYDADGITVIPFAGSFKTYEGVTPSKVEQIFKENSPMGGTTLAPVLKSVFDAYNAKKAAGKAQSNGELLIVITDGQPTDEAQVAKEIINFTKTLGNGDDEYGIQFIQVGKDGEAARFLKKLDDDLVAGGAAFDIVDTKTMEELENIGVVEALLAALND